MRYLRPGDYAIILAYFAVLVGIGSFFRKKAAAGGILVVSFIGLYLFWFRNLK